MLCACSFRESPFLASVSVKGFGPSRCKEQLSSLALALTPLEKGPGGNPHAKKQKHACKQPHGTFLPSPPFLAPRQTSPLPLGAADPPGSDGARKADHSPAREKAQAPGDLLCRDPDHPGLRVTAAGGAAVVSLPLTQAPGAALGERTAWDVGQESRIPNQRELKSTVS